MAEDADLETLVQSVRDLRGVGFSGYKRASLGGRGGEGVQGVGAGTHDAYRVYLESHPEEYAELFDTILINVTSFFRDADAWDYLAREVLPTLVQRGEGEEIRVWCPGCASGEEPFTVAILFCEAMGVDAFKNRVKIYATDVDEHALVQGRTARYSERRLDS